MKYILGCHIKEKIYYGRNSIVYRGIQESSNKSVVIKVLKEERPSPNVIANFKREYEILKRIDLKCVIKAIGWGIDNNRYAMVMDDFGGISVKNLLGTKKLNIKEFIELFINFAKILNQLHSSGIIHMNVNPSNFLWNPENGQLKIIDFSLAATTWNESVSFKDPKVFEDALGYISPEQTGRMNRSLDYRSDLYSLGVSFYEIMTGQLPFRTQDALELVHCHIAKIPIPPHHLDTTLDLVKPEGLEILSKIIVKLLSKNAENRYYSALGLIHDLERCLETFNERQTLAGLDFKLGEADFSDVFQIPQKLYGRENEIRILVDMLNRICNPYQHGSVGETLMVNGTAGIGKSVLVNEIHKHIAEKRGYFISGKFNRLNNKPYLALIQAFQDLVRQILTESDEQIKTWEEKILEALGPNGQVIIDVIPEVELIIGKQVPVPDLPPTETHNRFNTYFRNFIETFTLEQHPLSIFLDDLQWTDISTLKLLENLILDSRLNYLIIIGAYRDNEVDSSHPLSAYMENLQRKNAVINYITLHPLQIHHVNNLLADSLKRDFTETNELANLCLEKTNGNPFFLKQFLSSLVEERLIELDKTSQRWTWDLEAILQKGITKNVVELLVKKISSLPARTRRVIQLAACIGNRFDLGTLAIINERTPGETESELKDAQDIGLIKPMDEGYRDVENLDFLKSFESFDKLEFRIQYEFQHDRIHQAAYSLIGDDLKKIHKKIGQILLEKLEESDRDERIFEIVNHLNSAIDLINDPDEKEELTKLNYQAGKKAKSATAYEVSHSYFNTGISLLNENSWENQYELSLGMFTDNAEVCCLTGNFQMMEDLSKSILTHAHGLLDIIRINDIVITSFMARAKLRDGVKVAIEILKQLGVHIPPNPKKITVLFKLLYLRLKLAGKSFEDLKELPQMSDPQKLAAMNILMNAASATYFGNIHMTITIALKMVHLSVKYGLAPSSSYGFGIYGAVLVGAIADISKGYQFGRFAYELFSKSGSKEHYAKISVLFHIFIQHWRDRLSDTVEPLAEAHFRGIETGDYEYTSYCASYSCIHALHSSTNLDEINSRMRKGIEFVSKLNQEIMLYILKIVGQVTLNLIGKSENRTVLVGELFDEEEHLPKIVEDNVITFLGILYTSKSMLCFLFEEHDKALKNIREAEIYIDSLIGLVYVPLYYFYSSLSHLGCYKGAPWYKRQAFKCRIFLNQRKLKIFAKHAPENHQHKYWLVEAEKYRVLGKDTKAIRYYDKAITLAHKNGFTNEEALSNELAARHHLIRGNERIARMYMKEALYLYSEWGALAKVDQLRENYFDLFVDANDEKGPFDSYSIDSGNIIPMRLDMDTVQKASQVISEEIQLDRLLEKLLRIVVTNAGARKGYIILRDNRELYVEGEASADKDEVTVLQHSPLSEDIRIARTIINYVSRTKKTLVLEDASKRGHFINDDFIKTNQSKSIFCMPLISKMELKGIVYLENNLVTGSFTSQRTEILKMLAGQFMISIENARLYKNLEEYNKLLELRVKERTTELKQMNQSITNSINYASKIQNAILPPDDEIKQLLQHYFIIYKPLEIVSGDFYWVVQRRGKIFVAVADCTGHGVPGAFLSMLGVALLNDIVNKIESPQANFILNEFRAQVISLLHQTGKKDEARESMDIALCILDKHNMSLQFAGAHHPLYHIRNGELTVIKADMMAIGIGSETDQSYTNHELTLKKDDAIYLFSDGYTDQFGGENRKRFNTKRLKDLLLEIQDKTVLDQKAILEHTLDEWMGRTERYREEYEQIDDILLLGIRIS